MLQGHLIEQATFVALSIAWEKRSDAWDSIAQFPFGVVGEAM
jgi:hypothetical protein